MPQLPITHIPSVSDWWMDDKHFLILLAPTIMGHTSTSSDQLDQNKDIRARLSFTDVWLCRGTVYRKTEQGPFVFAASIKGNTEQDFLKQALLPSSFQAIGE